MVLENGGFGVLGDSGEVVMLLLEVELMRLISSYVSCFDILKRPFSAWNCWGEVLCCSCCFDEVLL